MKLRTLDDLEVAGKRVLLRADCNVPMREDHIADDFRIRASVPTIRELLDHGAARVIVCSHLGRPKGEPDLRYSLVPVAARLGEFLGEPVPVAPLPSEPLPPDYPVVLLENLRFHPGETTNDPDFARALASLADVYVDDAFGAVHRAHASVAAVAELLPNAAGRLLQREVEVLSQLLERPERPFVAIVGGAKVSDKLPLLAALLRVADQLLVGGGMCFTFFAARGWETGRSLLEAERVDDVRALMEQAGDRLLLPTDVVVAPEMRGDAPTATVAADAIPEDQAGYDIGPATARAYAAAIAAARTVLWNGPMGVAELDAFAAGTAAVAEAVATAPAFTVAGGGDSLAALDRLGFRDRIDHASTGGGAMLEFLEGKPLPGLTPLQAK